MGDFTRYSVGALWVTALGVLFAGSQLFIMAMSTSLESVNRWPVVSIEYARTADSYVLTVQNAGTGPALIGAVDWTVDGQHLANWKEALAFFGAPESDLVTWERISDRVIPANGRVRMLEIRQSETGTKVWEAWRTYDPKRNFSVCYCSSMSESWVGRWASWIAGMPVCWVADRRSLRPHSAPDNSCKAGTFAN